MKKVNNNPKYYMYGIVGTLMIGLFFFHAGLFSTIQQSISQPSYLDEGNITINGVFYNHHITLFAPASHGSNSGIDGTWNKKFYISKVYPEGKWTPTIVYLKIYRSARAWRYGSDNAVWYQIYDSGKLWQTSGKVLTNYGFTPGAYVANYKQIAQNSNTYIGIDSSQLMGFNLDIWQYDDGDILPAASLNIPPVIVKTQKQLDETKYQTQASPLPIAYAYLSHIGGQYIVPGLTSSAGNDDDGHLYLISKTYWYKNIFGPRNSPVVLIAFNVPDSNGNGVDDLNDIAPHDPEITTLNQDKKLLANLSTELKFKQTALNTATTKLNIVNTQLNAKLKVISGLNTNINALNKQLTNEEIKYQTLEKQVAQLQTMSNQLNKLILQSSNITKNVATNLVQAHNLIISIDTKLLNMQNIVKASSLSQQNKNNLMIIISNIRSNNQQLLVIIEQTQKLISQQQTLQKEIISKSKIISQQENTISKLTSQLNSANVKLTELTIELKSKQNALSVAQSKLNNIESQISNKIKEILGLNKNINSLNNLIIQQGKQYVILKTQITNLQNMSNQMNTLILQSSSITQKVSSNLGSASTLIFDINNKIIKMSNTIKSSSISQNNKNNLLNMLNSIKISNNQLLTIIQQTQNLVIQQKSLQLHILNQNKIISQKEVIIGNITAKLDNNDKIIYNMKNNNTYQYAIILIFGLIITILTVKLYEENKKR